MKIKVTRGDGWTLFDKKYPLPSSRIEYRQCNGKYVADSIGEDEIRKWSNSLDHHVASRSGRNFEEYIFCTYKMYATSRDYCQLSAASTYRLPVIISAQTGKGKNYFITHTLREFSRKHGKKILYISNRVALDYQQKKELANITETSLNRNWESQETFENVTVITYHKLLDCYYNKDNNNNKAQWLSEFDYVILDECHFFYSDAFFNPFTWKILRQTVDLFQNAVRIYLSATLEDVIDPIRYLEGRLLKKQSNEAVKYEAKDIDKYILAYEFPRNYSNYNVSFFSDWKQLVPKMISYKEKWLVFVTSKMTAQKMIDEIKGDTKNPKFVTYIDSDTRYSEKTEERIVWDTLLRTGKYDSHVLITTSVLDNGFSIKDNAVKHIVIFSHDRTEFLQELGRYRLPDEKTQVNLYVMQYTDNVHSTRKLLLDRYCEMLESIDGDGTEYKRGNICETCKELWKDTNGQQLRNCFSFREKNKLLEPVLNQMARWRIQKLEEQIDDYEQLLMQKPEEAAILYKAKWLNKELSECEDLDFDKRQDAIKKMKDLLDAQSGKKLVEGSEQHIDFSSQFIALFKIIDPQNTALSRSKSRYKDGLGHEAMKNRLGDLERYGLFYRLNYTHNTKEIEIFPIEESFNEDT